MVSVTIAGTRMRSMLQEKLHVCLHSTYYYITQQQWYDTSIILKKLADQHGDSFITY